MATIIYAGDCHGQTKAIVKLDEKAAEISADFIVQCGDLGLFWPRVYRELADFFELRAKSNPRSVPFYFVDGNHDNHDELDRLHSEASDAPVVEVAPNCFHIARATKLTLGGVTHLFCGGARSTDRGPREAIYDGYRIWWPQEAPSDAQMEKFARELQSGVEVVVTHEAPTCVPHSRSGRQTDPTSCGFDSALRSSEVKPLRWYYGHHHQLRAWRDQSGIDFFNCGLHGQCWSYDGKANMGHTSIV